MELHSQEHSDHAKARHSLLRYLRERLQRHGEKEDLDECISLGRALLSLNEPRDSTRAASLLDFISDLYGRFQKAGEIADLEEVIVLSRTILDIHPLGGPDYATHLHSLVSYLKEMLAKFGEVRNFDEAASLARGALELHPAGDPHHVSSLCTLADFLSAKFRKGGDLVDLEEAVRLRRDVLALSPNASSLRELAVCLSERFDRQAISLELSALKLLASGHRDWAMSRKCHAMTKRTLKAGLEGVRKKVMSAVYETLESLPPRLLNTHSRPLWTRCADICV